ncbi:putative RING-H2 finger protein ATL21A [Camellia lanceoleosa]|uniref:RING-H2 finger protein ATL21A n=1 Tax=Camellia lanceoleosa TaxID=1840588 RepID=A0ACC0G4T3_9ERIC|nr:putative RING-H2 finger protein ATL21A [Camellia lanceoleosa]
METSTLFLFFFFSSLTIFTYKASSVDICEPTSCAASEPVIRFPFRLKTGQPDRCGYPGFDLSCNNQTQTVLTLPHSGEFTVTHIDYLQQWISINDPNFCLPNRVQNLSLSFTVQTCFPQKLHVSQLFGSQLVRLHDAPVRTGVLPE